MIQPYPFNPCIFSPGVPLTISDDMTVIKTLYQVITKLNEVIEKVNELENKNRGG